MPAGRLRRTSAVSGLALGLIVHGTSAVTAAERICEAPITGGPAFATTESDARLGALTAWRMKAMKAHGNRHADWGLAVEKATRCRPRSEGGFECVITARPCSVREPGGREELGI
ncbi:MAG TPA: hypothetical protein PK857_01605 [Hyphomicrobium sp.]|nr:hypothetical protein [Hyphomicrobium sp.]HRO50966.1 hypothetical protein [Hyphomicrobium sp.]